jgi:putative DNA primase/helicase
LIHKPRGGLNDCRANAQTLLKHHEDFVGALAFDSFANEVVLLREPNWHPHDKPGKALREKPRGASETLPWTDNTCQLTAAWLERLSQNPNNRLGVSLPSHLVQEAVQVVARTNPFHPVKDFLTRARKAWDGQPRAETWLIRLAAVDDTPYVRAVSKAWLISAVARVFAPGCQADHMLILEGGQRSGKTTLLRTLCGNPDWYLETTMEPGSKDSMLALRRKWIVEMAELDSMSRVEASRLKAFITNVVDTYRPPYGRVDINQPRQCILAGTTNDTEGYLKDPTGNGRYWPVRSHATVVARTRIDLLAEEREQLWGEAAALYKAGHPWHLTDPKIIAAAQREQDARRERDPWEATIHNFIHSSKVGKFGVTTARICCECLEIKASQVDRKHEMRVGRILQNLGYTRKRIKINGKRAWRYVEESR